MHLKVKLLSVRIYLYIDHGFNVLGLYLLFNNKPSLALLCNEHRVNFIRIDKINLISWIPLRDI